MLGDGFAKNDSPPSTLKPVIATIFRCLFQEGSLETPPFRTQSERSESPVWTDQTMNLQSRQPPPQPEITSASKHVRKCLESSQFGSISSQNIHCFS